MEDLKTTWVFDEEVLDSTDPDAVHADIYDISINLAEKPSELGLDGGKILTLIIKKNNKPFYVYDKGKVELDDPLYSGIILKIVCDKYNHDEDADYYLNKLLAPGTGVTGFHIEIATSARKSANKFNDISQDLLKLINASIDYSKLKADNLIALITLDYKGTQYLMNTEQENSIVIVAERDIPGDTDTDKQECEAPEIKPGTVPPPPTLNEYKRKPKRKTD